MNRVQLDPDEHSKAMAPIDLPLGPFAEHLGLKLTEATSDRVVAHWTASEKLHQPHGIVHGGVHCGVVETLGSIGAAIWLGERGRCVGVSNTTDFLRPVTVGPLVSVATPVFQGRTQQLWQVDTHDESRRLVARGQVRVQNLLNLSPSR